MSKLSLHLDPWPAEYESAFQIEEFEDADATVETEVENIIWGSVTPPTREHPRLIYFVDGVRRVEARIIIGDGSGQIIRGLFGSVAVGTVRVEANHASFQNIRVGRYLVSGSGVRPDSESLTVGNAVMQFEGVSVAEGGPAAPLAGLQNLMRNAEATLAEELNTDDDDGRRTPSDDSFPTCVFADGPLTYFLGVRQPAIGVIKRLVEPYLSAAQFELVRKLKTGQRTPLFLITRGKYDRYSWYLRVASPRVMDHDVAGVLRLEVRGGVGLDRAIELADLSASCIPRFVAESFRDPRSPQNLLPIGALEQELRRRLGDPINIRRAIESRLFELSQPA